MTAHHPGTRSPRRAGVVLPAVLVLVFTVCLVVALVTSFSVRSMRLSRFATSTENASSPSSRSAFRTSTSSSSSSSPLL